jgi:hypothetical protein
LWNPHFTNYSPFILVLWLLWPERREETIV